MLTGLSVSASCLRVGSIRARKHAFSRAAEDASQRSSLPDRIAARASQFNARRFPGPSSGRRCVPRRNRLAKGAGFKARSGDLNRPSGRLYHLVRSHRPRPQRPRPHRDLVRHLVSTRRGCALCLLSPTIVSTPPATTTAPQPDDLVNSIRTVQSGVISLGGHRKMIMGALSIEARRFET